MTVGTYSDFFEQEADQYAFFYASLSEYELLKRVQTRRWDPSYMIWKAIAEKGTLEHAAPALLKVLRGYWVPLSHRRHAAEALFQLAKIDDPMLLRRVISASANPLRRKRKPVFRNLTMRLFPPTATA